MTSPPSADLTSLSVGDLSALRLAAQVMAHRAQLAGLPQVGLYFESLESAVMAEQAARAQAGSTSGSGAVYPLLLKSVRGADERRLIGEYLAILTANEQLPARVRGVFLALEAQFLE